MSNRDDRAGRAALKSDWKSEPMPAARAQLSLRREYLPEEFKRLAFGKIPREMEDKWFVYFEEPNLYLHRSWTGYCVYHVQFEQTKNGYAITQVSANRDAGQYTERNDERDALLLSYLLDGWAGRDNEAIWQQYKATL